MNILVTTRPAVLALVLGFWAVLGFPAVAADDPADGERSRPRKFFALPMEFEADGGADNGNAFVVRFIPLNSIPLNEKWKLINIAIAVVADAPGGIPGNPGNPDPGGGDRVFGFGDLFDAVILTPTGSRKSLWGAGAMVGLPTATDDRLGSGKWTTGPTVRFSYRGSRWNFGFLLGNLWSYAGDSDRSDVNQLLIRGLVRRKLKNDWFFTYSPIITANWDANSGQRWLIPVGGGIGKNFMVGSKPYSLSIQGFANVAKPDGAPGASIRFTFVASFPHS